MFASNIQESFFQSALLNKKHITVHLLNGVKISGKVRSFDKYSVVLETSALEQLIFKHSMSAAFICHNPRCAECFPGDTVAANAAPLERN